MGMSSKAMTIPAGPTPAQIAAQVKEQEDRVKYENEVAEYLRAAQTTEVATRSAIENRAMSLEYQEGDILPPVSSLYVPDRFRSAVAAGLTEEERRAYTWLNAENLGFYGNQEAQAAYTMQQNTNKYEFIKSGQAVYYMVQDIEAEKARQIAKGAPQSLIENYDAQISNIKAQEAAFNASIQSNPMTGQQIGVGDWTKSKSYKDLVSYTTTFFNRASGAVSPAEQNKELARKYAERKEKDKAKTQTVKTPSGVIQVPAPTPPIATGTSYNPSVSGYNPSTGYSGMGSSYGSYRPRRSF